MIFPKLGPIVDYKAHVSCPRLETCVLFSAIIPCLSVWVATRRTTVDRVLTEHFSNQNSLFSFSFIELILFEYSNQSALIVSNF